MDLQLPVPDKSDPIGTEEAKLLVFYTPAGTERFFLDHGDDPDPSGNPPPA